MRVGCAGFPEARPRYFRDFSLVELQESFYQPPPLGTAARWRDEAPEGFTFTLKAWQLLTHPLSIPTYRRFLALLGEGRGEAAAAPPPP